MEEIVFRNIAYCFYPIGLNAYEQKDIYIKTKEFLKLFETINSFKNQSEFIEVAELKKQINISFPKSKLLERTSFSFLDRGFSFQLNILLEEKIYSVNIYISFLIPNFIIDYKQKEEFNLIPQVKKLKSLIFKTLNYKEFPTKLLDSVVEGISFQDIKEGDFTFFNAFFSDSKNY